MTAAARDTSTRHSVGVGYSSRVVQRLAHGPAASPLASEPS